MAGPQDDITYLLKINADVEGHIEFPHSAGNYATIPIRFPTDPTVEVRVDVTVPSVPTSGEDYRPFSLPINLVFGNSLVHTLYREVTTGTMQSSGGRSWTDLASDGFPAAGSRVHIRTIWDDSANTIRWEWRLPNVDLDNNSAPWTLPSGVTATYGASAIDHLWPYFMLSSDTAASAFDGDVWRWLMYVDGVLYRDINPAVDVTDRDADRFEATVVVSSAEIPHGLADVALHDEWTGTGSLTTAESGQTWHHSGGFPLSRIAGTVGNAAYGDATAGYVDVDLGAEVTRVGAKFRFTEDGSASTGFATVLLWALPFQSPIPDSPLHLGISPEFAVYSIWDGAVNTVLWTHIFDVPLETDGTTEHFVDCIREGTTATVRLPDGQVIVHTDARIGSLNGDNAGFEVFHLDSDSDHRPRFVEVWADTAAIAGVDMLPGNTVSVARSGDPATRLVATTTADDQVDVTSMVAAYSFTQGRDRETDDYQPATATITLYDTDRRFDPLNEDGPHYGALVPLRGVQVMLDSANVENYVELAHSGGISVNYVDTPDSAGVSVTGDLDVRWFGTLTDWDIGNQTLMSHWDTTGNQRGWVVIAEATGVQLSISTNGTNVFTSTAIPVPVADGTYIGIRFARVQATGVTTLYTSTDDGATWTTQAPTTVLSAGTALHNSTAKVLIGAHSDGFTSGANGKVLRAEIRSVIDGTIVASPTFNTLLDGRNLAWEPHTDAQGNVWTGRGAGLDTVVVGGSNMFTGYVTDWAIDYLEGDHQGIVTVSCVDELGLFANVELDTIAAAHTGDTSGVRVARVLARSEVDFTGVSSIDPGESTLGNTTLGTNLLEYLKRCRRAEAGYLFVDRNGVVQFLGRHSVLNAPPADVEFHDAHSASGVGDALTEGDDVLLLEDGSALLLEQAGIPYRRMVQSSSADLLYNRVTGASETTGLAQYAADAVSRADYKTRTLAVGNLLNSTDVEVLDLLTFLLQRFKDPEPRLAELEFNTMAQETDAMQTLALLGLASIVTVRRTPLGVGTEVSQTCLVDAIRHDITPGSWTTTLRLTRADTRPFLVLDHPTFGRLNQNRLAF